MARKKLNEVTEHIRGEHLALAVAAHLARTQLVADPLARYDGDHLMDMVQAAARALARVAPLHVPDGLGARRELTLAELEGATVSDGATLLVLKDGRRFSSVTVRRADLRQAIAILKAVGVAELGGVRWPAESPAAAKRAVNLRETLAELERLLAPPLVPAQLERAGRLLVCIARTAPQGSVSNLAMQLMSCLQQSPGAERLADDCRLKLARLRALLEENPA